MFESLLKSLSGELLFDELHNSTYAAGTSLAGQCVGDGIIAAISIQVGENTLFTKIRNTRNQLKLLPQEEVGAIKLKMLQTGKLNPLLHY
ncbi:hypothetical protein BX611_1569 [Lutibacter oceani]|uniref:Uncharacterized protein n=1 Tax=Lutibacter oceani TaxID=1853311 RepID=A0A3D9RY32_9FLAO|nr:hypothetical protein [Lutibacter oceani]REE82026.1 hypothetical protein BX611_1569 [Lutibacter oceani]